MREMERFFREANQMIVNGRLYYSVSERALKLLDKYAPKGAPLEQALKESSPLEGHPAPLFLIPADLIKKAEKDMIA